MTSKKKYKTLDQILKQPVNFNQIKIGTGLTRKQAKLKISQMKVDGRPVKSYVDESDYQIYFYLDRNPQPSQEIYNLGLSDGNYLMGVYGDTHIGDKGYDHPAHLKYYDILDDRGVDLVLHAGDMITGTKIYQSQHVDLDIHTKMEQAEFYVDNCPELSTGKTLAISGNHDLKNLGNSFDPGELICNRKNHYEYLGQMAASVQLASGLEARLLHLKGNAYTIGYTLQKYIRRLAPNDMPNMIFKGHSHDALYAVIQGIHSLHTSTLQHGISNFAKALGFQDQVGAWIVEYDITDGKLSRFVPEYLMF